MRCFRFAVAALAAGALSSCGGANQYSYQNVSMTMSPGIASLAVGGTQTFTTTTQNAPNYPTWFVEPGGTAITGTLQYNAGSSTAVYTAPATPPVYSAMQVAAGAVQGQVTVIAFVNSNPHNLLADASATDTFTITAPNVTTGISPASATVARGASQQFTGYAVGNVNGAVSWQVNGVTGGSMANGTISTSGLYTAPATMPMAGPTVMVTVVSAADPAKSTSAAVTID